MLEIVVGTQFFEPIIKPLEKEVFLFYIVYYNRFCTNQEIQLGDYSRKSSIFARVLDFFIYGRELSLELIPKITTLWQLLGGSSRHVHQVRVYYGS